MDCMSTCQNQINKISISKEENPSGMRNFKRTPDICILYIKLQGTCKSNKATFLLNYYPYLCLYIEYAEEIFGPNVCVEHDGTIKWNRDMMHEISDDLKDGLESELKHYAHENLIVVKLEAKDFTLTQILKDEKTSQIAYIANAGGLLGLCAGISIGSIFEMIYHFSKFLTSKFASKRKCSSIKYCSLED